MTIIIAYNEKDIVNYYEDHFDRLKDKNIKFIYIKKWIFRQKYGITQKFAKIEGTKYLKKKIMDGKWKKIDINLFSLVKIEKALGVIRTDIFDTENDCIDLFIKYYGNYFGADPIVEQSDNSITIQKIFLYAYTLEENKSFFSMINNDFRCGDSEKLFTNY